MNTARETIFNQLQNLRKVGSQGRRILPVEEDLENLENLDTDVSGTAAAPPMQYGNENLPQEDMGGGITSQSYDVRANTAPSQEMQSGNNRFPFLSKESQVPQEEEGNIFSKIGSYLGQNAKLKQDLSSMYQPENEEQNQVQPVSEEVSFNPLKAIGEYISPTRNAQANESNAELMQNAQLRAQGKNPEEVKLQHQENLKNQYEQQKAMQDPWTSSVYGSAQKVAESPALSAEFKEITGIDYEPAIAQKVTAHEEAMKGVEEALNGVNTELGEEAQRIKERILTNSATDSDKLYIGFALLMPLLIGGIFGKEAGFATLANTGQSFANILGKRDQNVRKDEKVLADVLTRQTANQAKLADVKQETSQFESNLRKNLPKNPNEHLTGMREIEWTNPDTGEKEKGVEIKPGFVAKRTFASTEEGKANMLKNADQLAEVKTYVQEIDNLTDDIAEIVSQLSDPNIAWKGFTQLISKQAPSALAKLSQDVVFDGRKMNAGILLKQKMAFLANAYGMAKNLGQLDRPAQAHIKNVVENPEDSFINSEQSLNQMLEIKKLVQNGLINDMTNRGFYPEFIIGELSEENQQLFNKLNKNQDKKQIADQEKKLLQGEINYAK